MPYTFFFVSIAAAWILLAISIYFRSLYLNNIIIGQVLNSQKIWQ